MFEVTKFCNSQLRSVRRKTQETLNHVALRFCFSKFYEGKVSLNTIGIVYIPDMRGATSRGGRSLLGLPDRDENKHGYAQSEMLLEKDNDKKLEELQRTVSKIKDVSVDIETGIQQSNKLIDSLVIATSSCFFLSTS
jgi:hypothetical protein